MNPNDNKLHSRFNQFDADTGRSSSEGPNLQNIPHDVETRSCFIVDPPDENSPNGYSYITCDASGCELRIIAELSRDPIWTNAFKNNEDLHSVGTEILFPEEWPKVQLPDCAYFKLDEKGKPQHKQCNCPEHKKLRKNNKAVNFLILYGGGPNKLAREIKQPFSVAKKLMEKHERAFTRIWESLKESGTNSRIKNRSFDMFGRRRILKSPTWDEAKIKAREFRKDKLKFPIEIQKKNKDTFIEIHKRKPSKEELFYLENRDVNSQEIGNALQALSWGLERQGRNHRIQGSNASLAKIALTILWHKLPDYNAKIIGFVHDEIKIICPKRFSEQVSKEVVEAFRVSVLKHMTQVEMKATCVISDCWEKE